MAVIYNVTIKIAAELEQDWVSWMREYHIPDVMATACFRSFRLLWLEGYDDEEGITYAIQYLCPSRELYDIYQKDHAPELQQQHKSRYQGNFVAFRTLLTVIEEG